MGVRAGPTSRARPGGSEDDRDPWSAVPPSPCRRPVRLTAPCALLLAAAATAVTAAGCGDTGEPRGAGPASAAVSPSRLWPELTPASRPAYDIGEVDHEVVEGVSLPGGDVRAADPVAVVRAEIAASPGDYTRDGAPYRETARRIGDCRVAGEGGRCPVLRPYHRDLTGDGRAEMVLGFRLLPQGMTAVRVYTVERDRLVRIMSYEDAVSGVEVAGRSLVVRSPSEVAGYEYRLRWSWDPRQRAMLLTHDEMLRTADGGAAGRAPSPAGSGR